jgi:hypothetical protein
VRKSRQKYNSHRSGYLRFCFCRFTQVLEGVLENMCFLIVHKKIKSPETVKFQGFSFGGDKRDRTADLLNAIQALSQLSYTPKY